VGVDKDVDEEVEGIMLPMRMDLYVVVDEGNRTTHRLSREVCC